MKLLIENTEIPLLKGEYLHYHDGREGFPFNLDISICGIKDLNRANELIDILISIYPFPSYKMESLRTYTPTTIPLTIEVLFSISDFVPIIKE